MATLLELRPRVRDAAGIHADDGMHPDSAIDRDINSTLQKLSTLGDPWWLLEERTIDVVADQHEYAVGADVVRVRWASLEEAADTTILPVRRRSELGRFRDEAAGKPEYYATDGATIYLAPKPAASILPATLRTGVVLAEARLAVDGDTPKLPDHYSDALVAGAAYRAAIRANNPEMAAMLRGERDEWFLVLRDNMRRGLAAPRIRITREW